MHALKTVWDQFAKDFDKLPGWVPLYVVVIMLLELLALPDSYALHEWTIPLSTEVVAALLTLLLYTVGDALDEAVFKTGPANARSTRAYYKIMYKTEFDSAAGALGVASGLYRIASQLSAVAEKHRGKIAIHIPNESAKFLRALIVPLLLVGAWCLLRGRPLVGILCWIGATGALYTYPLLKVAHIRRLYEAVSTLTADRRYHDDELGSMRLVFWGGTFVGSGGTAPKRAASSQSHSAESGAGS